MRSVTPTGLLLTSLVLAACGSAPPRVQAPAPELQLLDAAPLMIADGCVPSGSYIVNFTVDRQGRTTDIAPPDAPACVREALAAWAASFRYAPPATRTPASVEWLLVTGSRGS